MAQDEYKTLRRKDLVEIIYALQKNEEILQARIQELEAELKRREDSSPQEESILQETEKLKELIKASQIQNRAYLTEVKQLREENQKQSVRLIAACLNEIKSILKPLTGVKKDNLPSDGRGSS